MARLGIGAPVFCKLLFRAQFCFKTTLDRSGLLCHSRFRLMSYHVVAFTMAQVRQGALEFQRELGAVLAESKELKVYSTSPFDLDERRRAKDRFGGDVVYFFNDAAREESRRLGLKLQFVAEITEEELPRRRAVVVGIPESKTLPDRSN
jgi:hypothetical protein